MGPEAGQTEPRTHDGKLELTSDATRGVCAWSPHKIALNKFCCHRDADYAYKRHCQSRGLNIEVLEEVNVQLDGEGWKQKAGTTIVVRPYGKVIVSLGSHSPRRGVTEMTLKDAR